MLSPINPKGTLFGDSHVLHKQPFRFFHQQAEAACWILTRLEGGESLHLFTFWNRVTLLIRIKQRVQLCVHQISL
jgi:hypothetical protein